LKGNCRSEGEWGEIVKVPLVAVTLGSDSEGRGTVLEEWNKREEKRRVDIDIVKRVEPVKLRLEPRLDLSRRLHRLP
jgi:hypothetical protein